MCKKAKQDTRFTMVNVKLPEPVVPQRSVAVTVNVTVLPDRAETDVRVDVLMTPVYK